MATAALGSSLPSRWTKFLLLPVLGCVLAAATALVPYRSAEYVKALPDCSALECNVHYAVHEKWGWPVSYFERTYVSADPTTLSEMPDSVATRTVPLRSYGWRIVLDIIFWTTIAACGLTALSALWKLLGLVAPVRQRQLRQYCPRGLPYHPVVALNVLATPGMLLTLIRVSDAHVLLLFPPIYLALLLAIIIGILDLVLLTIAAVRLHRTAGQVLHRLLLLLIAISVIIWIITRLLQLV